MIKKTILVLSWFDSFVMSGWKKPVNQNDLWDLSYQNSYKGIVHKVKIKSSCKINIKQNTYFESEVPSLQKLQLIFLLIVLSLVIQILLLCQFNSLL